MKEKHLINRISKIEVTKSEVINYIKNNSIINSFIYDENTETFITYHNREFRKRTEMRIYKFKDIETEIIENKIRNREQFNKFMMEDINPDEIYNAPLKTLFSSINYTSKKVVLIS